MVNTGEEFDGADQAGGAQLARWINGGSGAALFGPEKIGAVIFVTSPKATKEYADFTSNGMAMVAKASRKA